MPISDRDRARLAALILLVRPARSIAARVQRLSDEHRDWYQGWVNYWQQWIARNPDGEAYGLTLQGYGPTRCRPDISVTLFGELPRILDTLSDDQAQQVYRDYCDEL